MALELRISHLAVAAYVDAINEAPAVSCLYRKLDSAIMVMKATKDRRRCDSAEALDRAMERGIFVQRAMNSSFVVIAGVGSHCPAQVCLAQHNDVINALAADRADQPLGEAVLPRRAWGDGLVTDAHGAQSVTEAP